LKNNKILIHFGKKKMIRGKYEVYSGRSHLSADRQGRQTILFPKAIDDHIPAPRQAGLPAGRNVFKD